MTMILKCSETGKKFLIEIFETKYSGHEKCEICEKENRRNCIASVTKTDKNTLRMSNGGIFCCYDFLEDKGIKGKIERMETFVPKLVEINTFKDTLRRIIR